MVCLPDSILRKAAQDINRYEQDTAIIAHMSDGLFILNEEIRVGDSVQQDLKNKLALKDGAIGTWKNKYEQSEQSKEAISNDFLVFKKRDKTKMWIAGGLLFLALSGWAGSAMR